MIETQRLTIKPLSLEELKKHIQTPELLARDLGLASSISLTEKETNEAILNDLLPNLSDPHKEALFYTLWIVIEKNEKSIIGGICFHGEPDENGEVEIGYGIDDDFQNSGYMTETIAGLICWAKTFKGIRVIKAETETTNRASVRVLEKNGFELVEQNGNSVIMKFILPY